MLHPIEIPIGFCIKTWRRPVGALKNGVGASKNSGDPTTITPIMTTAHSTMTTTAITTTNTTTTSTTIIFAALPVPKSCLHCPRKSPAKVPVC